MGREFHNWEFLKPRRKRLRNQATIHETILWSQLKGKQLGYKFRRQHSIGRYIVDFYCPEKKLVIEVDGGHHMERKQLEYDRRRDSYIRGLGFRILRVSNYEVNTNLDGVVWEILKRLEA